MARCKMLLLSAAVFLIAFSSFLQGASSRAVLLVPDGASGRQAAILTGRLEAVFGTGNVTVNPGGVDKLRGASLVAGFGANGLLDKIAESNALHLSEFDLNGNGYVFRKKCSLTGAPLAAAHDFLGLYYAIQELEEGYENTGKVRVEDRIERPALRWRGVTAYDNWDSEYMDSLMAWVLANRLNRVELKETDLDDFIYYEEFPELEKFRDESDTVDPGWGDATLRSRAMIESNRQWLRSYVRKCHDYGLEIVMWHHEFVVLEDLCQAYPGMCDGDSLMFDSDLFFQWLEAKYDEFFQGPGAEIDGIVLTTVEGNVHLVDFGEGLIFRVLDMARSKCNQYGKKLIFRTFGWDDPQETALANVANKLPDDIWMMHKHIPMDWCDAFPHNPNLQRVRGKKSLLETELAGEQRGNSRLPVWVGDYFKYRLRNAMPTGILGAQGRINRNGTRNLSWYHHNGARMHDRVYGGSFNPNICNLFVFSRLCWDPEADVSELYLEWAEKYYGRRAAPHVVAAFRPMRQALQQMMLGRGQFLNLRFVMDYDMWREVMHWGNNLSDFDKSHPVQFRLRQLEQPDQRFFGEFIPEKDEAIGMVTKALGEVRLTRGMIPEADYRALEMFFGRMLNLAEFCRYQMEAFGWIGMQGELTEQARTRLIVCRDRMKECAAQLPRWDPHYRDANTVLNIEQYPAMMSCIEEIEKKLAGK